MSTQSDYGIFWGDELLDIDEDNRVPIVDGMLWEKDTVFFVAKPKVGKSIFSIQMLCAITAGESFLDTFPVNKPLEVCYIQTEGKLYRTRMRLKRITNQMSWNPENFTHIFQPGIALNTSYGFEAVKNLLVSNGKSPKVICIDPLYTAIRGDMSNQDTAAQWVTNVRLLQDTFGAAVWIVHHTHKDKRTDKGVKIKEGDDAIFGSFVWKAYADHVFMMHKHGTKKEYTVTCDTQRESVVVEKVDFALQDRHDVLLYTKAEVNATKIDLLICRLLKDYPNGLRIDDLVDLTDRSKPTVNRALARMTRNKTLDKESQGNKVLYKLANPNTPKTLGFETPDPSQDQYHYDTEDQESQESQESDTPAFSPPEHPDHGQSHYQ